MTFDVFVMIALGCISLCLLITIVLQCDRNKSLIAEIEWLKKSLDARATRIYEESARLDRFIKASGYNEVYQDKVVFEKRN
jgi:hypothetical protein